MGIDGIGKGGPPAIPPSTEGPGAPQATGATPGAEVARPFAPKRAEDSEAARAAVPTEAVRAEGALAALRSGAIDLNGYLDQKVSEATAHLVGLPSADLLRVRAALRDRLASDPTLVELVTQATGRVPQPPDDD
jgi:hypothetical protein